MRAAPTKIAHTLKKKSMFNLVTGAFPQIQNATKKVVSYSILYTEWRKMREYGEARSSAWSEKATKRTGQCSVPLAQPWGRRCLGSWPLLWKFFLHSDVGWLLKVNQTNPLLWFHVQVILPWFFYKVKSELITVNNRGYYATYRYLICMFGFMGFSFSLFHKVK